MLFVIYVRGGSEISVLEQLRRKGYAAYCPRRLCDERRRGEWQTTERIIFTGYLFIDAEVITAEDWHRIASCDGFIKFVSMTALSATEDEYIRALCADGECIGVSRGYIKCGALHITEGFAKKFEHKIVKFNRRGRRATADITICGQHRKVIFSVIFDDPPASGDTLPAGEKI